MGLTIEEKELLESLILKAEPGEFTEIQTKVRQIERDKYKKKVENNRKSYQNLKKRKQLRGEEIRENELIKPGYVIKVEGTNDRNGYRLVMSIMGTRIVCRKLVVRRPSRMRFLGDEGPIDNQRYLVKDTYITDHAWDKVVGVFDIDFPENEEKVAIPEKGIQLKKFPIPECD